MDKVSIQRLADRIFGGLLCGIYSVKKPGRLPKKDQIRDILIVRLWTLGESILTLPMIERLRREFPNAKITVLARNRNKEIFKHVDFIDDILLFERENLTNLAKLRTHYDVAIDTEPYLRISGLLARFLGKALVGFDHGVRGRLYGEKIAYNDCQHSVLTFCDLLRPFGVDHKPTKLTPLKVTGEILKNCRNKLEALLSCRLEHVQIIGIHAGTAESAKYRAWPKENFAKLIQQLLARDKTTKVVLTGSKAEYQTNENIAGMTGDKRYVFNLAGILSFDEFIALFDYIDCFISNDTGPMHLAAAQGCKTIGLFGPNLPLRFGPYGHKALYHGNKLPCSPCINVQRGKFAKCKRIKDGCAECMRMIEADEVIGLVR